MGETRSPTRLLITACVLVTVALITSTVTDVQAHARSQNERRELSLAQSKLAATQAALNAATKLRDFAEHQQDSLQAGVTSTLENIGSTQQSVDQMNVSTYLEGLDIGNLQKCLGGIQRASRQIAVSNNDAAISDLSGVSSACLSVDKGDNDGLVYPFDFPDPFVLRVGAVYFAYATNSVGGNIQIIESGDLTDWNALGNALPSLPKWASSGRTWAPSVVQIGGSYVLYYAVIVAGSGEECLSAATSTEPQGPFVDSSSAPLVCQASLGGSIEPVALRGCRRNALPRVEIEWNEPPAVADLVSAAQSNRHSIGGRRSDGASRR
jgi:hypothetical protein